MSMFKYPLSVTVDTNIFDAAKFDLSENSTIRLLENYVKDGKIQVVLSDIVIRESKAHFGSNQESMWYYSPIKNGYTKSIY